MPQSIREMYEDILMAHDHAEHALTAINRMRDLLQGICPHKNIGKDYPNDSLQCFDCGKDMPSVEVLPRIKNDGWRWSD